MACVLQQLCETNDAKEPQGKSDVKGVQSRFSAASLPVITIYDYLVRIFTYAECSPACFILALIYIDRVIVKGGQGLTVNSKTIHRLLITSIMVAAKFIDDVYLSNAHFARMGGIGNKELNKLELDFLFYIEFSLLVPITTYQQYRNEIGRHASLHVNRTPPMKNQPSACSIPLPPVSNKECSTSHVSTSSTTNSPPPFDSSSTLSPSTSSTSSVTSLSSPPCSSPVDRDSPVTPHITSPTPTDNSSTDTLMKRIRSSPCLAHVHSSASPPPISRAISSPCLTNLKKLRTPMSDSPCLGNISGVDSRNSSGEPMFSSQVHEGHLNKILEDVSTSEQRGKESWVSTPVSSSPSCKSKAGSDVTYEQFQDMETIFPVPNGLMDFTVHSAKMISSPSLSSTPESQKHQNNFTPNALPNRRLSSPISISREFSKKEQSPNKTSTPDSVQNIFFPSRNLSELNSDLQYQEKDSRQRIMRKDQKRKSGGSGICDDKKPQQLGQLSATSTNRLFIEIPKPFIPQPVVSDVLRYMNPVENNSHLNESSLVKGEDGVNSLCDVEMMENSEQMDTGSSLKGNVVDFDGASDQVAIDQTQLRRCSSGSKISKPRSRRRNSNNSDQESSFGPVRRRSFSRTSPSARNSNVARRMSASTSSLRYFRFGGEYERRMSTPSAASLRRPSLNGPAQ